MLSEELAQRCAFAQGVVTTVPIASHAVEDRAKHAGSASCRARIADCGIDGGILPSITLNGDSTWPQLVQHPATAQATGIDHIIKRTQFTTIGVYEQEADTSRRFCAALPHHSGDLQAKACRPTAEPPCKHLPYALNGH